MITRVLNRTTNVSRLGFFWKKQAAEEPRPSQQAGQDQSSKLGSQEWKGKEEFLKELRQKREEYERVKMKQQKEAQTLSQRQAREHEVNFGRVDYARVLIENINIFHTSKFQHPDELFHFLGQLDGRLTEKNLMTCVNGLVEMADRLTEDDLIRYEYLDFQSILERHLRIVSSNENFIQIVKLLDILCIPSGHRLWEELELVLLKKMNKFSLEEMSQILTHLGNQKEGTDVLWDKCENYILALLEKKENKVDFCISLMLAYWRAQKGTAPFINRMVGHIIKDESRKELNTMIQLNLMMSQLAKKSQKEQHIVNQDFKQFFERQEAALLPQLRDLQFDQVCLIAQGFGFDFGSDQLFQSLEELVLKDFEYGLNEIKLIMKSFLLTYRGSKRLVALLMEKALALRYEFNITELSQIVKAVYITENDSEQFYYTIERTILERLKDVKSLSVEEIFEVAQSYLITRVGSRELYKLLEIIIKFRFEDIRQDAQRLAKLHDLYQESALCDPELIQRMAAFL